MSPATPTSPKFYEASPSRAPTSAMAEESQEDRTFDQLQTPEQVLLLDTIDELRNQGLDHHGISLPQLIVCGDQSSGKSSLLEGLTRLRFPIHDEQCTTFATEVVLRREANFKITCTIIPGRSRSPEDREELNSFEQEFLSSTDFQLPTVISDAKALMARGQPRGQSGVSEDVLRVRYCGPDLPSLTIVDLPGMIEDKVDGAGDEADRILELVTSYMRNEKSIILAVVHTGSDLDNQKVLKQLKKYDPQYTRTLGIITKPDRIDQGSPEEKKLIRLAQNERTPFLYRWHAVRNRSSKYSEQSDTERDEIERQFFATGLWSSVPRADVGIESLRIKLSRVLLEHVGTELPSIVTAVQSAITSTRSSLKALGDARDTTKDQRTYLITHAQEFHSLTQDALRGVYTNPFFGLSSPDEQTPARLRTAIQNLNIAFAHVMYSKGHTWDITVKRSSGNRSSGFEVSSHPTALGYDTFFEEPAWVDRTVFLENTIEGYVRQSRQSGLTSLVNPLVVSDVFREQSRKWRWVAKHHLQQVFEAIKRYIEEALSSLMDPQTYKLLMLKHIQPELDRRWDKVDEKLEELLVPYTEQDPMTYDLSFIRNLQELRMTRQHVNEGSNGSGTHQTFTFGQSNMGKPYSSSSQRLLTEFQDDFTNSEILDLVTTYYNCAISVFISNIAVLAVENCLIKNLSAIFSPTLTASMDDEQLRAIAAESAETRSQRSSLKETLAVLESGKQVLSEHVAKAPGPQLKKASRISSREVLDSRPSTPSSQLSSHSRERPERRRQGTKVYLTAKLNNLVVTPPPSGSNTRESSRRRVDSATTTPPKSDMRRPRNPLQALIQSQPGYESDEEL